ncbi:MAG: hypothetical protein IPM13_05960 [Phycisphaerales bacterium]|nr:hypothetical protein [Phycisphaerales bacterium]
MRAVHRFVPLLLLGGLLGCAPRFGPRAEHGIIFYIPGAGNVDLGDAGLRRGLRARGYQGEVARLHWTYSFNVAIDQSVRAFARLASKRLAEAIQEYSDAYPGRDINLVGLSAGTGIAIWALEDLRDEYSVNNVVLLSSSLWHRYDVSAALEHVRGKIYCYYSPTDAVLTGPMKVFGTIDGVFFQDGAGAVGLHPPPPADERVVNIAWRPEFQQLGYWGGHFDSTSPAFIEAFVADHLLGTPGVPQTDGATVLVSGPQDVTLH